MHGCSFIHSNSTHAQHNCRHAKSVVNSAKLFGQLEYFGSNAFVHAVKEIKVPSFAISLPGCLDSLYTGLVGCLKSGTTLGTVCSDARKRINWIFVRLYIEWNKIKEQKG